MIENNGGAAFPHEAIQDDGHGGKYSWTEGGMTLLDYFAGQFINGVLMHPTTIAISNWDTDDDACLAMNCYRLAAAMLAEKERRETK